MDRGSCMFFHVHPKEIKHTSYLLIFFLVCMYLLSKNDEAYGSDKKARHILLIGASVGNRWHFDELQSRINTKEYTFEYVGVYKFDKSKALKEILNRSVNRPDAIIIKECAAYFPGDLDLYESLMKEWCEHCVEAKVVPIPATVVPVTRTHNMRTGIKIIIKRILGRIEKIYSLSRIDGILSYNDWMKDYAQSKGFTILDLESALHSSPDNRYLKSELTSGDGLHLTSKAYELLDKIVLPSLKKVNWDMFTDKSHYLK